MNVHLEQLQKDFEKLSNNEKKETLLELVDLCKDSLGGELQDVKKYIYNTDVSNEYLYEVYSLLITAWSEKLQQENKDKSERIFTTVKQIMLEHIALETKEKEWVDAMLSSI